MYRRNKKIACALALLMVVNNVSTSGILAYSKEKQTQTVAIKAVNDINIVSTTTVTIEDAKRWAKKRNATQTFIGLADLFWKYAPSRGGVNPALAYVQSALETGYGRFGNVLDETYYNTCGLKRTETGTADDNNDKEAHKRFDNWDHGVQAHLDHLALYAGAPGFPKTKIEQNYLGNNLSSNATYDPRHFGYLAGKAKTATQLSNSWATSVEYGEKLVELYNSLLSEAESGRRGWLQDGDDWYYYNETGELHKGWLKLSDGTYYLNENGIVHKGWFQEGDNKYYFDNFGRAIIGRTETINGKSYTFDKEGKLVKENLKSGWHYEDYYWQYYKDGKRQHGWINIPNDGKYYVESYGMVKGWYDVEGKRYYFDDAGRAIVGKTIEIEGKEYAFDNEGVLVKALKSGWHYEDYYWQYYKDGKRQHGWINIPNDGKYYVESYGMVKGWYDVEGKRYYFDDAGRAIVGKTIEIEGKEYTFNDEGVLVKSLKNGWHYEDYYWQYYKDGERQYGWINVPNDGKYYVEPYGMVKGWHDIEGKRYYFDDAGRAIAGRTENIEGKNYTFDENGVLQVKTGWCYEDYHWQYYNENGERHQGWLQKPEGKYYLADYGMVKGWFEEDGKRYNFDDAGIARKGWINMDGKNYYFYDDCHAAQFEFINGKYIGYDGYVKDKMTIVIDPGHNNGGDSGASCVHDGIVYDETQMNMDVAVKLRDALLAQGYNVIMTRQPGEIQTDKLSQSLLKRVVIANNEKADLFISIHHDSYNETSNGMTVFYDTYRPNVETNGVKTDSDGNDYDTTPCRAAIVSKEFTADLAKNLPSSLGLYNRGARYRNFYVTRNTIMPSMLIECGFISNPDEAKKLADPLHQLKMAGELTRNVNKLYKK
ncbi:MAG: N-acetylmuramoyl-L-alanine amidase [Clostridium cadaveris]|uniref:N-acetylmuramoyl-L-alanine amidase n=1 Tax=Clostridium cadaveris TaxID=1529 RepID=UPI002A8D8F15|nr:N-acetylmuramoyl-L-alanine amidase [Clostridium cadaveris]